MSDQTILVAKLASKTAAPGGVAQLHLCLEQLGHGIQGAADGGAGEQAGEGACRDAQAPRATEARPRDARQVAKRRFRPRALGDLGHHHTLVQRFPYLPPSHTTITPCLLNAAAKSSQSKPTATTQTRAQLTQVPPRRTTGWSRCSDLCSAQPGTRSARNSASPPARANGAATWRPDYLRDQAGSRSLVFDLAIAHDRFGSSSQPQQNGCLSHPQDLDAPLRIAAQRKINGYRQDYADNHTTSPFSPPRVHLHPHARRICASSFSTGPPGDRSALHGHWTAIAKTRTCSVMAARHSTKA